VKKIISVMLVSCMLFVITPTVSANTVTASGQFPDGTNDEIGASWILYNDGTLTIGEGFIDFQAWMTFFQIDSENIYKIIFTEPVIAGTHLTGLFSGLSNVKTIEGLQYFDVSNTTNMDMMFYNMSSLTSLNLSNLNTKNVTTMAMMFYNNRSLTNLDLSGWNTGNVTNMWRIFDSASNLTQIDGISYWDTSNVMVMDMMFHNNHNLTSLDLSRWNTGNATRMGSIFYNASGLTNLDLSGWDTSNVTDMRFMFYRTSLTHLDLSHFDTQNVIDMRGMFSNASNLTSLDISNFDTRNVTRMGEIFNNTTSLGKLTLSEYFHFGMFSGFPGSSPTTQDYIIFWRNIGEGTIAHPLGRYALTSQQLVATHNDNPKRETWVLQSPCRYPPTNHLGDIITLTNISKANFILLRGEDIPTGDSIVPIIAFYNNDGQLLSVSYISDYVAVENLLLLDISSNINYVPNTELVKIFIWNSFDSIKPLIFPFLIDF